MTDRDAKIVELTKKGLSARKVKDRLGLDISPRAVQVVAARYLGPVRTAKNSYNNTLDPMMLDLVRECLDMIGLDRYKCGICGDDVPRGCDVHHTKYEGATIYDLIYVCRSCNCARENRGLT